MNYVSSLLMINRKSWTKRKHHCKLCLYRQLFSIL